MNIAVPLFSETIGLSIAQARGSAVAYSEKTKPTGGEPRSESKLSLPTSCHVDPFTKWIDISCSRLLARISCGNASSILFLPVWGFTASQIALRH